MGYVFRSLTKYRIVLILHCFCNTSSILIWVIFWCCDNVKQKEKKWDFKLIFCLAHDNLVNSVIVVCCGLTSIFLRANKQSLVVDCKNVVICVIQLQKVTLVTKVKSHKSNLKSMDIYIYIGWCSLLFNDCLSEISHFDIFNPYEIEISYRCRTIIVSN